MNAATSPPTQWSVVRTPHIEAWQDAVLGAGLEAVQMSRAPIDGSLAFASSNGVTYSSGRIGGQVALNGSLSDTGITLGVGLRVPPGTRLWLDEVGTSTVAVYLPGDQHESFWRPGSLYATALLSAEKLEELAADIGLVLNAADFDGTGLSKRPLDPHKTWLLEGAFRAVHSGRSLGGRDAEMLSSYFVDVMIEHLGREPRISTGPWGSGGHSRIVSRARDFIEVNLPQPLSAATIARAVNVSRSTLHRAFLGVLDETAQSYVLKLRLNRLRQSLASPEEAACTIAVLARRWGLKESVRLSHQYFDHFGEYPDQTREGSDAPDAGIARIRRAIGGR